MPVLIEEKTRAARIAAGPDGVGLSQDDIDWLRDRLRLVLNGETDLETAFGLKRRPGQRTWRTCAALQVMIFYAILP